MEVGHFEEPWNVAGGAGEEEEAEDRELARRKKAEIEDARYLEKEADDEAVAEYLTKLTEGMTSIQMLETSILAMKEEIEVEENFGCDSEPPCEEKKEEGEESATEMNGSSSSSSSPSDNTTISKKKKKADPEKRARAPRVTIKLEKGIGMEDIRIPEGFFNEKVTRVLENYECTCNYCYHNIKPRRGIFCGGCGLIPYCSEECLAADWQNARGTQHFKLCPLFQHPDRAPGVIGKTLIRAFISSDVRSGVFTLKPFNGGTIVMIARPARETDEEMGTRLDMAVKKKVELDKLRETNPTIEAIPASAYEKIKSELKLSDGQKHGAGMYDEKVLILRKLGTPIHTNEITTIPPAPEQPFHLCYDMALLNHSCRPNCYFIFDGYRFYLVTNRDIKRGEQLTIRYDDPFSTLRNDVDKKWYHARLWNHYGIKCDDGCVCQSADFWATFDKLMKQCNALVSISTSITDWMNENQNENGTVHPMPQVKFESLLRIAGNAYGELKKLASSRTDLIPRRFRDQLDDRYIHILTRLGGSEVLVSSIKAAAEKRHKEMLL